MERCDIPFERLSVALDGILLRSLGGGLALCNDFLSDAPSTYYRIRYSAKSPKQYYKDVLHVV